VSGDGINVRTWSMHRRRLREPKDQVNISLRNVFNKALIKLEINTENEGCIMPLMFLMVLP
jgi:hypothetical protein